MTKDKSSSISPSKIIPCLVRPTGPANIGAAARAGVAMGLGSLRLVKPHADLDIEASKMAAGAQNSLKCVTSFDTLDDALKDIIRVYGFSARRREHRVHPVWIDEAVAEALAATAGGNVAFLFGTERTGLENNELDRANVLVRIPTSDEFRSINLAQSVMIAAYEVRRQFGANLERYDYEIASADDVERCIYALAKALDRRRFFMKNKRALALRRIRDLLGRAVPHKNEISLLRGMIRSLDEDPVVGLDGYS